MIREYIEDAMNYKNLNYEIETEVVKLESIAMLPL